MFSDGFVKVAFISRHSDEALVKATPKKHGGSHGSGRYFLRYHDKEKRWSCTCPDWTTRRRWLPEDYSEHWDCKHIRGHKKGTSAWLAKGKMPRLNKTIIDSAKNDLMEQRERAGMGKESGWAAGEP